MIRWFAVAAVLAGSLDAAADPSIHRIAVDDTIVADTPSLTLAIQDAFRATVAQHGTQWTCAITEATNLVVSWGCSGVVDNGPNTGGSFHASALETYAIDNGKLVALDWDKMWKPGAMKSPAFAKVAGLNPRLQDAECTLLESTKQFTVDSGGIDFELSADTGDECSVSWSDITPFLLPGSPLARVAAAELAAAVQGADPIPGPIGAAPAGKTPSGRFVADGADVVRDTQTGLAWAAHDNGADLDATAAAAYAKAFRGGGHDDWRLPTIDELAAISAPDLAHRDKADCTHGQNAVLISPLLHISCGLVWSSTTSERGQSGFGFISGTPRVSKPTERKNYRALVVRKS